MDWWWAPAIERGGGQYGGFLKAAGAPPILHDDWSGPMPCLEGQSHDIPRPLTPAHWLADNLAPGEVQAKRRYPASSGYAAGHLYLAHAKTNPCADIYGPPCRVHRRSGLHTRARTCSADLQGSQGLEAGN